MKASKIDQTTKSSFKMEHYFKHLEAQNAILFQEFQELKANIGNLSAAVTSLAAEVANASDGRRSAQMARDVREIDCLAVVREESGTSEVMCRCLQCIKIGQLTYLQGFARHAESCKKKRPLLWRV